jgi:hypothetical protein
LLIINIPYEDEKTLRVDDFLDYLFDS